MPAKILSANLNNLATAVAALLRGEVVAMPTETVYGLAGVALDERAVASIFAAKERPTFDPLICHVPEATNDWLVHLQAQGLVDVASLSRDAQESVVLLARAFWPGPLTLVLPRGPAVPDLVTSELPTVGVRCPRHPVAQQLLHAVGLPLAAPSANRFGRISPTSAAHVQAELGDRIGFILDGGDCEIGIESTVLLVEPAGRLLLLRPGAVTPEDIARVTGSEVLSSIGGSSTNTPLPAPGMLASHYAPRKPLHLLAAPLRKLADEEVSAWLVDAPADRLGVMVISGDVAAMNQRLQPLAQAQGKSLIITSLSPAGDAHEAARHLFSALRALDDCHDVDALWAEPHPDATGLGHAINDRLSKASYRPRVN